MVTIIICYYLTSCFEIKLKYESMGVLESWGEGLFFSWSWEALAIILWELGNKHIVLEI